MGRHKENLTFFNIEGLTHTEVEIIKTLLNWNHQLYRSSSFILADFLNLSESGVVKALRKLKVRGIVTNSHGVWHLNPKIKEMIKKSE